MAIDRRIFLAGAAAAVVPGGGMAAPAAELIAAACREPSGAFAALACDLASGIVTRVPLPARGHDVAVRPGTRTCVVFARRPGTFAAVFTVGREGPPLTIPTAPGRTFFGHGVFSPDGRLLYSTEHDSATGQGAIGVRDATGGYREIGSFPCGGIDPHDIALLSDETTLVVANGGIDTGGGREPLNLATMEPSLAYIDASTGALLECLRLPSALHKLSIRHLAVVRGDTVAFGCQYEGAPEDQPALVGFHRRGEALSLVEAPDAAFRPMQHYVGSVAADRSGTLVAATSPRGGLALIFDAASRRLIGESTLADVSGVTPRHSAGGFLFTSGFGAIEAWSTSAPHRERLRQDGIAWDNHATLLPSLA